MTTWRFRISVFTMIGLLDSSIVVAQNTADRHFTLKVLPLLKSKCFACHGDDAQELKGKLDIRSRQGMLNGGESGEAALVPGKPEVSPLYQAIRWDGLEMPPKENDRLTEAEIELVRQWIVANAPWPDEKTQARIHNEYRLQKVNEDGELVATSGGLSDEWTYRRYQPEDLWAFRPIKKVDPPKNDAHPIDAFINRKLNDAGLASAARADHLTLIRRAAYDLTGLPPTPEEIEAFARDSIRDPQSAFRNLVDRLLDSDHYGEQMARHWLDVVRYADSAGYSNDFCLPNAWRYRDYVIRSFNNDKPYDLFVKEQLAGDEIAERMKEEGESGQQSAVSNQHSDSLIAVGFLRMGPWEHTSMSVAAVTRQQYLDDITNSVGETFLANSLRCCKCHDHKFDPLPTRDYYRMQAVFATVQFADRDVPFQTCENTNGLDEGRERIDRLIKDAGIRLIVPDGASDQEKQEAGLGVSKVKTKQGQIHERTANRYKPLALSVYSGPPNNFVSNKPNHPLPRDRVGRAEEIYILTGGSLESPTEKVSPGIVSAVGNSPNITDEMDGRRSDLADWIANRDNPLTARVIVNRVWQWHFGKGPAANPNNFGKMGAKPTHPELLDWLARWFMDNGWSIKTLHRLIMTSDVYARSGDHPSPDSLSKTDPDNRLLAWFPPRRLSAEEIRDSMLLVSGELNHEMGGVPIRPVINREVAMQPRHVMGSVAPAYQPSRTPAERNRRTIYALKIRTLRDPMLEVFDQPGPDLSCERRDASTVTPQVFSLFNSEASYDRSLAMAKRISDMSDDPSEQVDAAFRLAFGRSPTDEELAHSLAHVKRMTEHHRHHPPKKVETPKSVIRTMVEEMTGLTFQWEEQLDIYQNYVSDPKPWDVDAKTRALADLCLVLLNSNEFVYVY